MIATLVKQSNQTITDENTVGFDMAMSVAEADAILADAELLVA